MTDKLAVFIKHIIELRDLYCNDFEGCVILIQRETHEPKLEYKKNVSSYSIRKNKDIVVEFPFPLADDDEEAIAQIGLAVGRRLERFERASKANAGRDADSRKQIAQNAIKKRWSTK